MAEDTTALYAGRLAKEKRRPFLVDLLVRLVREKPLGTVGAAIVLLLLLAGIFANWLAPYGYNQIWVGDKLAPPSAANWLGTDNVGRDLLSRIIYGARISMFVGLGVSTITIVLNAIIGLISGFLGGKTDLIIQRFVDAWMCFPGLILVLTVMAVVGTGLVQVIVVLGVLYGIGGSRTVRSAVIGIKENVYVEAARAVGCPTGRILLKHILPNVIAPLIIIFSTVMGAAIIAEASISFLGYGIPPPIPSWGGMLSGTGRRYMVQAPWLALWPGLALSIVVYGANMFGDALRDLLDPRLRGGLGRYSSKNVSKRLARRQQTKE
ncbi:MAG TPA: ABC transporter permease [Dehalococcoidales bacterium]